MFGKLLRFIFRRIVRVTICFLSYLGLGLSGIPLSIVNHPVVAARERISKIQLAKIRDQSVQMINVVFSASGSRWIRSRRLFVLIVRHFR